MPEKSNIGHCSVWQIVNACVNSLPDFIVFVVRRTVNIFSIDLNLYCFNFIEFY